MWGRSVGRGMGGGFGRSGGGVPSFLPQKKVCVLVRDFGFGFRFRFLMWFFWMVSMCILEHFSPSSKWYFSVYL